MYYLGKMLLFLGLIMIIVGVVMVWGGKIFNLGRLPGDIFMQKGNFTFYFPLMTMVILSLLLTVILNLIFRR